MALSRMAESVCKAMATKVLKQRPGTVKRASDAFLLFVELEQAEVVLVTSIARLSVLYLSDRVSYLSVAPLGSCAIG